MEEKKALWKSILTEDTRIDYGGERITFHTIDKSLLKVVNKAVNKEKRIAINYPVHLCNMVVAFALESYYTYVKKVNEGEIPYEKKIFVISDKVDLRDVYDNLFLNGSKLSTLIAPLGMVSRNGEIKPVHGSLRGIAKRHKKFIMNSRMIISTNIHLLPNDYIAKDIGAVVVDVNKRMASEDIDHLLEWCDDKKIKPVVFIFTDPYSYLLKHIKDKAVPIWGWTPEMLGSEFSKEDKEIKIDPQGYMMNYFLKSALFMSNSIKGVKKTIVMVKDDPVLNTYFEGAAKFFIDIFKMYHKVKDPHLKSLYEKFGKCIGVMEKILAPIDSVELSEDSSFNQVHTLANRIGDLKSLCDKLGEKSAAMRAFAQNALQMVENIYNRMMEKGHPKTKIIVQIIKEALENKNSLLILNYRQWDTTALYDYLEEEHNMSQEHLESNNIYVRKFNDLADINFVIDKVYVCGSMPFRPFNNRLVLRLNISEETVFLLYPSELLIYKKAAETDEKRQHEEFGLETRAFVMSKLLGVNKEAVYDQLKKKYKEIPEAEKEKISRKESEIQAILDDISKDLLSEDGAFRDDWETDVDAGIAYEDGTDIKDGNKVKCNKVIFNDGSVMFVTKRKRLPCFIEKGGDGKFEVKYVVAGNIKKDYVIIIVNKGARDTVEKEILNTIHSNPKMRKPVELTWSWVTLLKKQSKRRNEDSHMVYQKLKDKGITVGEQAVASWLNGEVIGPMDLMNIHRIGEAYNIKFLTQNYEEITKAVKKLRSIHHTVLRRLIEIIIKKGIKASLEEKDLIDEELGIHIEDFSGAITMKPIKNIEEGFEIPYNYLNRVLSSDLAKEIENGRNKD